MTLFTFGLAKKVLLADAIGALWTDIIGVADSPSVSFVGLANASTPLVWLGVIAYSLQLYFDFSGYSLMGIGMGKMLGFDFPQNFNYPYISASITEFWRRWHMTLSGWFREYVYIPLGGNRKGLKRQIFNLFVVELLTGIWHGANWNFICWGLYYFVLLALKSSSSCPTSKGQGLAPYLHPLPRGRGLGHVRGQRRRRGVRPAVPQAFHPFRRRDAPLLPAQLRRTAGGLRRLLHPAHRKAVEAAFPQCHHQGADHSGAADGLDGLRRGQHQQPVPVFQLLRGGVNDGQTFKALRFDFPLSGPYRIHPVFAGLFLLDLVTPDRAYSELENTTLSQRPSLSSVSADGLNKFFTAYTKYVKDQVAGRDNWIALQSTVETKVMQKEQSGGILLGKQHMMFPAPTASFPARRAPCPRTLPPWKRSVSGTRARST